MPDLIAISQGFNAVKATTEIVKTMLGLRDSAKLLENTVKLNLEIISIQNALFDAQKEQTALIQTIRDLEEKITKFEAWETEKNRYELAELTAGSFAYILKAGEPGSEYPHYICTTCYHRGKVSILQIMPRNVASTTLGKPLMYRCSECRSEILA
jgi:hypothetical protein